MATDTTTTTAEKPVVHTGPILEGAPNEGAALVPVTPAAPHGQNGHGPSSNGSTAQAALVVFSPSEIDIIKHTYMPGATDDELAVFIKVCLSRQLSPFTRQIFAIKRKQKRDRVWVDVWSAQTSIDGFRLIAERTGKYRGQTVPLFCGPDGVWTETWLSLAPPAAAKVGVLREDFDAPIFSVALWREYVQTFEDGNPMAMWAKMPTVMIAKVAEALALRKAFPEELSGLYTSDEMAQAGETAAPEHLNGNGNGKQERAESRRAGAAAAGSGPVDLFAGIDPTQADTLPVERALELPLVGNKKSWGGLGGTPLARVPYDTLARAFAWFGERLDQDRALESDHPSKLPADRVRRFEIMRLAIPMVSAKHDAGQIVLPLADPPPASLREAVAQVAEPAPVTDMEQLQQELKGYMNASTMPKPSREWFSGRLTDGRLGNVTAVKLHIALAWLCVQIGELLTREVDPRKQKEVLGLLREPSTYKSDVLAGIRDGLERDQPGTGR